MKLITSHEMGSLKGLKGGSFDLDVTCTRSGLVYSLSLTSANPDGMKQIFFNIDDIFAQEFKDLILAGENGEFYVYGDKFDIDFAFEGKLVFIFSDGTKTEFDLERFKFILNFLNFDTESDE